MPTKLLPLQIFRPSYGPADAAYVESASSKSKSSSLLFWFILRFSFCFSRNTFKGLRQGQLECVLRSVPQQTDGVNCSSICFLQSKWALERTLVHYGLNLFIKSNLYFWSKYKKLVMKLDRHFEDSLSSSNKFFKKKIK